MIAVTRHADATLAPLQVHQPTTFEAPLCLTIQPRKHMRGAHADNAEGRRDPATALSVKKSGGVLLSHAVPHAVPSALKGLTSGFGMGPGVSPSLWPPKHYGDVDRPHLENRTVDAEQTSVAVREP